MSVKYRKVKNNRKNSTTYGKVYGRAVVSATVHTKAIAQKIGKRCTVTEPDILAVLNALEDEISDNLAQGNRVVLDDFGSFKVGLNTTPADSAKKFTSTNIKGMHVIFQPAIEMEQGKRIKSMLRGITCEEQPEYETLKDGSNGTKPSGGSGSTTGSGSDAGGGSTTGSDTGDGSGSQGGNTSGNTGSDGGDVSME